MAALRMFMQLLIAFVATGRATAVHSNGDTGQALGDSSSIASIARVQDTLQSLLKSVQDLGRNSGQVFGQRQKWCQNATRSFGQEPNEAQRAEVSRIQTDYREHQASLEEAVGTEQQLRTETMLVQHTINVTSAILLESQQNTSDAQKDEHLLSELLESRQQTLVSLEGELDNLLPMRSHLQVRVAELRRQMNDRMGSANAMLFFSKAVHDACSGSVRLADVQAEARVSQAHHITMALQALGRISAMRQAHAETPPVSFLQLDQDGDSSAADDLSDVFGNNQDSNQDSPDLQHQDPPKAESQQASDADDQNPFGSQQASDAYDQNTLEPAESTDESPMPAFTREPVETAQAQDTKPLLVRLRAAKGADGEAQREWCTKERAHSELLLELARDSLDRVGLEIVAHADAEAQLEDAQTAVRQMASTTEAAAAEVAAAAQREVAFISDHSKDRILATKILKQAVAVLGNLEDASGPTNASPRAAAISELSAAQTDFQDLIPMSGKADQLTKVQANEVAARASNAARAFRREEESLELARDAHRTERMRLGDGQQAREAETKEAAAFIDKLAAGCAKNTAGAEEKQRQAEVHALDDVQRVIEGKAIGQTQNNKLRGVHGLPGKRGQKEMTPIERAALTMGVAVDDT